MIKIGRVRKEADRPKGVLIDAQVRRLIDDLSSRLGTSIQASTNIAICIGLDRPDLVPEEYRNHLTRP